MAAVSASAACVSAERRAIDTFREAVLAAHERDLDRAAELAGRARDERPGFVDPVMLLGRIEAQRGNHEAARTWFLEALGIDPTHTTAGFNVGMSYLQEQRLDEAAQWFRRAIEADPGFAPAAFNLGSLSEQQRDAAAAMEWFRVASALDGRDPRAPAHLARLHLASGRAQDALDAAEESLRRWPEQPDVQAIRAEALRRGARPSDSGSGRMNRGR